MTEFYFVAGTDTGVGKTVVTSALSLQYQAEKRKVGIFKPIESGLASGESDVVYHQKKTGDAQGCYVFQAALTPSVAAAMENIKIDFDKIKTVLQDYALGKDIVLVEGAGGLMVPLTDKVLQIDWMAELHFPVILVARNALGTINHTLLSIEALQRRNIKIHSVILNQTQKVADDSVVTNAEQIQKYTDVRVVLFEYKEKIWE